MGLKPLYSQTREGQDKPVIPKILIGNNEGKVEEIISYLASEVQEQVLPIATTDLGKLTFAAYSLLETLHRAGMPEDANLLISDFNELTEAALHCAIGIEIGRRMASDVRIETIVPDEDTFGS